MLFPDVTCTVSESLQKNKDYGLYDVLEMDCMIVFTLFRDQQKIQVNGIYEKRHLNLDQIYRFVESHYEAILAGKTYSNYLEDGYYYHMTSRKQASPFVAFTMVVREGEAFDFKDIQWLDVYEKLNYRRALIENEALQGNNLYNSLLECIRFAFLALNHKGIILQQNRIAHELFGIEIGEKFVIADSDQQSEFQHMFIRAVEGNMAQQASEFVYGPKENMRIFAVSISPLLDSKNKVSGAVITALDKTEERMLQVEVEQLKRYGFIGEFSMGLAHDIKNPLMIIQGCTKQLPSECNALKNIIYYQAKRINDVITQFMSVRNFADEAPSFPLDLNTELKNALSLTGKYQLGKQIQFHMELDNDLPLFEAKELHMQQIFSNLILNAMDAIPSTGEIFLSSAAQRGTIMFQIHDTGIGIPQENIPQLFTPYFTTKKNGTGMGLFIVKQLVEQYGGSISFQSSVGKGTTCRIYFPVR